MALETATYLDELNSSNPPGTDQVKQADDHLRLVKAVAKATFPGLTRPMYLEKARSDLASATTPDLGGVASNYVNITGTTQIEGFADEPAGFFRICRAAAALPLKHHATALNLPGSADVTLAAGDHFLVMSTGTSTWDVLAIFKKTGVALVAPTLSAATETDAGLVFQALTSEIFSANAANANAIMAQDLETAAALVALTDAATVALDWDAGINRSLTVTANRALGAPTNGQVGTMRTIVVQGNDGTARTLTFNAVFQGEVPTLVDITSTRWYELYIRCHVADTHYSVSAKRIKG
jgi:hypothetical protein